MAKTFRCRIVRLEDKPRCHLVIDNYDEVYHRNTIWQKEPPVYLSRSSKNTCSASDEPQECDSFSTHSDIHTPLLTSLYQS